MNKLLTAKIRTIRNYKEWLDFGNDYALMYRMVRIVGNKKYEQRCFISKLELHHRYLVSLKLRQARLELRRAILLDLDAKLT